MCDRHPIGRWSIAPPGIFYLFSLIGRWSSYDFIYFAWLVVGRVMILFISPDWSIGRQYFNLIRLIGRLVGEIFIYFADWSIGRRGLINFRRWLVDWLIELFNCSLWLVDWSTDFKLISGADWSIGRRELN